jgi:hypothetical protein
VWTFPSTYLYRAHFDATLCNSCKAVPVATTKNSKVPTKCLPHVGEFDLDTNQPLDDAGEPFMPGLRRCGNADCVNTNHIMTFFDLEAERLDISYRTNKKLTSYKFFEAIEKERFR